MRKKPPAAGTRTARHQMSIDGQRDHFTLENFRACARTAGLKRGRAEAILAEDPLPKWRAKSFAVASPTLRMPKA